MKRKILKMESYFDFKQHAKKKMYSLDEGIHSLKAYCLLENHENIEIAVNLHLNKKQVKKTLSNIVVLPHMEKQAIRVIAFTNPEHQEVAKASGADLVIPIDQVKKMITKKIDLSSYQFATCTPELLPKLRPIRSILGPKGLMPNAKNETISTDLEYSIKKLKETRLIYKTDKAGVVHVVMGKIAYSSTQVRENISHFMESLYELKPSNMKGNFIKNLYLTSTYGPSFPLSHKEFLVEK